jgi:RND family efflux transporter MFP subunit
MGQHQATAIAVVPVTRQDLATTLDLTGSLAAEHEVGIAPRTSGRLISVQVNLGDPVRQGQVLARLDDGDLQARLSQAHAALASAQATLRQRQIDQANLSRQAARDEDLLHHDFIARQDYETSRAKADSAAAMVSLSRADIARQRAVVGEAQAALAQAVLVAPMAGTVSARHLDAGAMATPGSPVVSLVAPGALKVVIAVPETVLPKLKRHDTATVRVDAWPDQTFTAAIRRVAPIVSAETRTGQVELKVTDPGGKLRPGMFARVALPLERRRAVPVVPLAAVVSRDGAAGVFVTAAGKARFVPVTTGLTAGDRTELRTGPAPGTPVVTLGNNLLKDGDAIRLEGGKEQRRPRESR